MFRSLVLIALTIACSEPVETPLPPDAGSTQDAIVQLPKVGCAGCLVFTGGTVFDGTNAGIGTVVVEGTEVREVVLGDVEIEDGQVIDLAGKTIMPGLFDMHVHSPASAAVDGFLPGDPFPLHFKAMLRSGVTSFLDLGTSQRSIFEYRKRLREGQLLGPRLFAAGPLVTATGGHPCYTGTPPGDACVFIDAPEEADALIPPVLERDPDVVKIVVESGVLGHPLPQLGAESIGRVNTLAEAAGKAVIAHVSEAEDVEIVLDQGVRALAHVPGEDEISDDLAARLASLRVLMVPTLVVYERLALLSHSDLAFLDAPSLGDDVPADVLTGLRDPVNRMRLTTPDYMEWSQSAFDTARANFTKAVAAGVTIAAGTDAGNPGTFHGRALHRELELYVENGMTPIQALAAATKNAADFLSQTKLGRLEPGATADLLIVDGDATADITAIEHTSMVILDGTAIDRDALVLARETSLVRTPIVDLPEGSTCFDPSECAGGTYCGWQRVCSQECSFLQLCADGSACFPQDNSQNAGFCYEGDGCDPVAQNCENGEACIWLGNAASLCWVAGLAAAGETCDPGQLCAPGFECDFATNVCIQICDPMDPAACPAPLSCTDISADAGLPIGECR